MTIRNLLLVCGMLLPFLFLSAQVNEKETIQLYKKIYKDKGKIAAVIKEEIKALQENKKLVIEGEEILSKQFLPRFYEERDYNPAWADYESFLDAITAVEGSYDDGLVPTDYNLDGMLRIRDAILKEKDASDFDYSWTAKFDILLTDAIFLYAFHLFDGKTDPHSLDVDWNFGYADLPESTPEELTLAIDNKTLSEDLDGLRPAFPEYRMMMKELAKYRDIHEKGGWKTIEPGGKIDPGDKEPRIPEIRQRLSITGDLTNTWNLDDDLYDPELEIDIRSFQDRHGLASDGVIGKGTFAALNIPVEKKISMLRVNLERTRWIMNTVETDYIVVNIARFKAFVEHDSKLVHETNVMVGRTYHKTPVFRAKLAYIEFNPTWTVPVSITRKELVPKIQKDPGYLKKKNMVLLDGSGNIVPESSVDMSSISSSNFPYTIRQEPGPGNALGEVKFIFPNSHSVYLHDTQSKSLFTHTNRTFSHGCIRVQNPHDLAEVLLKGTDWDRAKIDATVASRKTIRAYPETKFDVYLLYWTTGYIGEDKLFFLPDVYNRDQAVLNALDKKVSSVRSSEF